MAPLRGNQSVVPTVCLNLYRTLRFLNSVALAVAIQRYTKIEWKEYRDSKVLNAIYTVMFWKGAPGTVEVGQNWTKIEQDRVALWRHLNETFFHKASLGPQVAIDYLEQMGKLRESALQSVQQTFQDASDINREIAGETGTAIKRLAAIKAGSTIALAGMTGGLALTGSGLALAAANVGFGYKIVGAVATNLASGKDAKVMAIDTTKDVGKEVGEEKVLQQRILDPMAERAAHKIGARAAQSMTENAKIVAEAERRVQQLSVELARKTSSSKIAKLGRQIGRAETQKAEAMAATRQAGRLATAGTLIGRSVPVIFAVKDIVEAIEDYHKDVEGVD
jgi:hypothetical protein